ncbi:oligosaccharide flippase family protein [Rhizobium sp. TH2]|uniref:oligosaccharide flippase family protein n=1 Tax=Rhizobium sp. TH2 TaxID=2775403 RepID=UPI002157F138|nr:oligosaccharide flippase family protein [Rhizobium sp. TH2]UVC07727.1 oligosaccharide flippase family protein [Rhizobium sp. TH2]
MGAGVWTLTPKIASQVAQLAAFILAARVLTSTEFGFYAYSSAFALLFVAIAEGGWGEFVLKSPDYRGKLSQIATAAMIAGTLITILGLAATALIALYFDWWEEAAIIALFSCWFLPSAMSTVYDAILVAEGRLRDLALIRIVSELVGFGIVLYGIHAGWGVVFFVAGRLGAQLTNLSLSIAVTRWLPRLQLSWEFCKELLEFSRHIVANRIIIFFRSYSATLLVGSFLGLAEAGYYRAAERIIAAVSELIGEPARILTWTRLRKVAHLASHERRAKADVGRSATTIMSVLLTIALPVYVGLALVSEPLVRIVLGDAWAPTSMLITLLALKQVLLVPGYVTEPLLSLSGNIRKMPRTILLNSLVGVGFLLVLAPFGMLAAAYGQCAASLVSFCISIRLQSAYGGMNWGRVLRDCSLPMIALAVMVGAVIASSNLAQFLSMSGAPSVVLQVLVGALIYFMALAAGHKFGGVALPIFGIPHRSDPS